jgi:RNA polymerase sigma-70 factor, ECF subfamily
MSRSRTFNPPKDLELASRLANRDEEAFRTLVERYHGSLLRLALTFVANRAAAEEVVQDTWLGVVNGIREFQGRSTLKGWIFRILTNRAKTRGVRDKRSVPFSSFSVDPDEPAVDPSRFNASGWWARPPEPWEPDSPEDLLIRKEARAVMEHAIGELPPNQRAVLTLRDIEGFESAEVCNILELSETNQRVLLHRARSKIRQMLERHLTQK